MKLIAAILLFASLASSVSADGYLKGSERNLRRKGKKSKKVKKEAPPTPYPTPYPTPSPTPQPTEVESVDFEIKLTPGNEVAPFVGVQNAFGTANLAITSDNQACIVTDIEGFTPAAMHIHRGQIDENGDVVVNFASLISPDSPDAEGCVDIEADLAERIIGNPSNYYVNVHIGDSQPLVLTAIRGQLVQGFTATLENSQTVAPFNNNVAGASGTATVIFEDAGQTACFDVKIQGFDPALGHVHRAAAGENGPRVFNYSSLRVAPGFFFGCLPIADLEEGGVTIDRIKAILGNPSNYYFDYHLAATEPEIFTSIRGQFPA